MSPLHPASGSRDDSERIPYHRLAWRLVPLLFAGYVIAYLNRVNLGFAKLEMIGDLGFTDTIYGLGAGIFFLGYFLFEVPSNLLLHKFGARRWIARIMMSWGLISAATMFVATPTSFYVSRFLLGLAEAGFFPGIVLYLSYWFPSKLRARMAAFFMSAIPVSGIVGGPLSGWIMHRLAGVHGLPGWKWLFFLEAIPALLMGPLILAWLPDSIGQAQWLSPGEKIALEQAIAGDHRSKPDIPLRNVLAHPSVWQLSLIYFTMMIGLYGIGFWMPQILRNSGVGSVVNLGLLTAVPYAIAAVVMVLVGRSSDRRGERRWHSVVSIGAGSVGFCLIGLFGANTAAAMAGLVIATCGVLSAMPLFWTFPSTFLGGAAAAVGIALINSVGNLGGFVGPYFIGALNDATHSQTPGLWGVAGCLAIGALLIFRLGRNQVS